MPLDHAISVLLGHAYHILLCSHYSEEFLELYVKANCLNRELIGLKETVVAVTATSYSTFRMVELTDGGEQPAKSYKRFEVPLKPGTDTKQLVKELCKNEAVQQVAIVRPRGEDCLSDDVPIVNVL